MRREISTTDMNVFLEESKKGQQFVEALITQYEFLFEMKSVSESCF